MRRKAREGQGEQRGKGRHPFRGRDQLGGNRGFGPLPHAQQAHRCNLLAHDPQALLESIPMMQLSTEIGAWPGPLAYGGQSRR